MTDYDQWLERPYQRRDEETDAFEHWVEANDNELRADFLTYLIEEERLNDDDSVDASQDEDRFLNWAWDKWEMERREP